MSEQNDQPFFAEHHRSTLNLLQRLQEHTRSNIPAMMAQRAASTFSLQPEPTPQEAADTIAVTVYPQDPFIGKPEVRFINATDIRPGLVNARLQMYNNAAQPDEQGDYLYWPGTLEFSQVNSFYFTNFTLRMYEWFARRAIPWSFPTARLTINPRAGNGANAFYSEQDRMLGFYSFALRDETIHTADSADIVSHEAAHAILDGLRDLYNESFGLGPTAFHESFGDMTAVLVALHDDSLVRRLLELTGGNLSLNNFIASVAEYMTQQLQQDVTQHVRGHTIYLRNALNNLTNKPFDALPYALANPEFELGRQSHNYSRLFTGAFYDLLVAIYELESRQRPQQLAVHKTRDILGFLLVEAIELGPVGEFDYSDMAKAVLMADVLLYEGRHVELQKRVFEKRGILPAEQADAFLEAQRHLPDVSLPTTLNSALASALFLEEVLPALKIMPDAELIPLAAVRNAAGYAHLTYFMTRRISLSGKEFGRFDGAALDAFGGLTLTFGPDNRLKAVFYRPVTDEDARQIRVLVTDLITYGLVADEMPQPQIPVYQMLNATLPKAFRLPAVPRLDRPGMEAERPQLVRLPVIFDNLASTPAYVADYLNAWLERFNRR